MNRQSAADGQPDARLINSLQQAGLIANVADASFEILAGGVSSDIWKVTAQARTFCVKRALPKLRVEADWQAPVERNRFEVAWYRITHEIVPQAVPKILFHDDEAMICAMEYLDPRQHRLWKSELQHGRAEPADAAAVGLRLGRIHAATANNDAVAVQFPPNELFYALRLEPYLEATAAVHPDLHDALFALSRKTAALRIAMVHGDVSPKNILLGPHGPVFLDAECACMGDPAFDLAFCLNHLLLKSLWAPQARYVFGECFQALIDAYLKEVDWEATASLEVRAANLLPALLLARVDGKSPVEYIDTEVQREHVRRCARPLIKSPPTRLADVLAAWNKELET